ncbi:thiamine-monophosphate kinase [Desulfosarcina alkanivorans]|uniref:Thiamine-monophosphate kinase n=1 Tax=Desulfosarcina alkanivorans TaxID=571177 RepID=A0A5K7YCA9_9BACT|nr:thiamine-phosphate kinase [Desulfosarcina alkanivorans]BBO66233.1 thiamine-monophosphate kinase [Desulfosarcina alkanivorans]
MRIHDIGGEFALIDRLARQSPITHPDLLAGIGDDAAVIEGSSPDADCLLVTTDMLVESSHFRRDWATPEQIGIKAVACNVSDIAAMGGTPTFMFVSLALAADTEVAWVDALYRGMADACRRYGVVLAGGDTTHAQAVTISITMLGRVAPPNLRLRSHATPAEYLCVTGPLGGSAAGLAMLSAGLEPPPYLKDRHLAPGCRLDVSAGIAPLARAMIDISDGLAAEVNHICDRSGTGADIVVADIPIHPSVREAARLTGNHPLDFALSGGEDFELLFSISPGNRQRLDDQGIQVTTVGAVTDAASGRMLTFPDGRQTPLSGGYNHFSEKGKDPE